MIEKKKFDHNLAIGVQLIDMNEVPFRRYKTRAIWEYLERYRICSKRDRLRLTNSSIIAWNRAPISCRAEMVFICDGLNVDVLSVLKICNCTNEFDGSGEHLVDQRD